MIIDVSKGNVRSVDSREIQINSTPLGFVKATRDVGFYMLFFPQLIAGPIVRARQFWPQIESKKFRDIQWGTAFKFLTLGYFLKMVVADNLAEYTPYLKSLELVGSMGGKELLTLMFGYSFQIFSDFGGLFHDRHRIGGFVRLPPAGQLQFPLYQHQHHGVFGKDGT